MNKRAGVRETAKPKHLHTAILAAGALSVFVWDHEIGTRDGIVRCWTYVSKGMEKHGQREVVFTLRRRLDQKPDGFPKELFNIFDLIFSFAARGQLVNDHGFSVFATDTRLLGREGRWGLMYLPAQALEGIEIPSNALSALLIKDDETEIVQYGLHYRLAASLAGAYRHLPFPPWSDPDRAVVVTNEQLRKSILSKGFGRISGLSVRGWVQQTSGAPMMDGKGRFGSDLALSITREAIPQFKSFLSNIGEEGAIALRTDPDPRASSKLYWHADTGNTIVLQFAAGPGRWTTGGFLILGRTGKELKDGVGIVEDGFQAILTPSSWQKLTSAIESGLSVVIPGQGDFPLLRVDVIETKGPRACPNDLQKNVFLYSSAREFEESGIDDVSLADYIGDLSRAAFAISAGYPQLDIDSLLIAVAVKAGSKAKVWCESADGGLWQEVQTEIEKELVKLRPLPVRVGPVAFALAGSRWTPAPGESPGFPRAWTVAADKAGKPLAVSEVLENLLEDS